MKIRIPFRPEFIALLVIAISMIVFSSFLFTRIDQVVNGDLYRYGLEFNYEWAVQYWAYARVMLASQDIAILTLIIFVGFILTGAGMRKTQPIINARNLSGSDLVKLIAFIFLSVGGLGLVFSIIYASAIMALVGLGLVFWGAILYYIRPEKCVKEVLLDTTTLPSLANLNQIIVELGYEGKAVYLPPRYFKDFESCKVYISKQNSGKKLPLPIGIQKEEDRVLLRNQGMFIIPPGMELTKLFENRLGTNFTKVDLKYFEQNLPKLLVENLEIAEEVEIRTENSKVYIEIENSAYANMCNEARKLSKISGNLGCPLCSAIACLLAKATRNLITIEREEQSQNGKTTRVQYSVHEE
jgi:hypothetical protein